MTVPSTAALNRLIQLGGIAAIIGGGLRVVATFIPYAAGSAILEILYAVIDVGLLFGLIAIYLGSAEATGRLGLAGFFVSLTGLASIVGPDAPAFGVDFYQLGSAILVLGLVPLATQLVRLPDQRLTGAAWLVCAGLGLVSAVSQSSWTFAAAGAALGTGFALGGAILLRTKP
jgi:hypothetical protein